MKRTITRTDFILWSAIALYTGIIYATLSIVSRVRKVLTETFGYGIFNGIYWVFALIGIGLIIHIFQRFKGNSRLRPLVSLAVVAGIYAYSLARMDYAVEKIHFLEYGILGALVFTALKRQLAFVPALLTAINITYWLGLGDEFIQYLLPARVGEIRDGVINGFSGALGIAVLTAFTARPSQAAPQPHIRMALAGLGVSAIFTALFIALAHGFGYQHQTVKAGIVYSSLSLSELDKINAGEVISPAKMRQYRDEACRHLLQREFYCVNDYMGADGSFYRQWNKCGLEQRILESHYSAFLKSEKNSRVGPLLEKYDSELAVKVADNPVRLDSAYRTDLHKAAHTRNIYRSRVKSTLITGYSAKDLVYYTGLFLIALIWIACMLPEQQKAGC